MNLRHHLAAALALGALLLPGLSPAAVITGTLSAESNTLTPPFGLNPVYQQEARIADPTPAPLNLDFSTLGDEPVRVDFLAPAGQVFQVDTPGGPWGAPRLAMTLDTGGNMIVRYFSDRAPTFSFIDASGPLPGSVVQRLAEMSGAGGTAFRFLIDFALTAGQSFSFRGLSLQTTVPAVFDTDFTAVPVVDFSIAGSVSASNSQIPPPDPGQWVHLAQASAAGVPAPPTLFVLLGGMIAYGLRRHGRRGCTR